MFHSLINHYEYWMVAQFGYERAVWLEEFFTALSTYVLGMLTMALLSSFFILRLHSLEDFGKSKIKMIRVDHGKKSQMVISITNLWSALETILFLSFSPFLTINRFTSKDARRTKRFLVFIEIITVVIIVIALISIFSVLKPI